MVRIRGGNGARLYLQLLGLFTALFVLAPCAGAHVFQPLFPYRDYLQKGNELRPVLPVAETISTEPLKIYPGMSLNGTISVLESETIPESVPLYAAGKGGTGSETPGPEYDGAHGQVRFMIEVLVDGDEFLVFNQTLSFENWNDDWFEYSIPLDRFSGMTVHLRFLQIGTHQRYGVWAVPALVTETIKPQPPDGVILVSLDTLRADHLPLYGYPLPTSPFLDALSRSCLVFCDLQTSANWTLTAHASMLTGLDPLQHGLLHSAAPPLPKNADTLAERFHRRGYRTAAFTGGGYVGPGWDLERGFEVYSFARRGAAAMVERGLRWLDSIGSAPYFLFLHTYETHAPYNTFNPHRIFSPPGSRPVSPDSGFADHDLLVTAYDDSIRNADTALEKLCRSLQETGLLDSATLLIVSDHGEGFNDHGSYGHGGIQLNREQLHVPLLVKPPRKINLTAGQLVPGLSSLCEIPELVEALSRGDMPVSRMIGIPARGFVPAVSSTYGFPFSIFSEKYHYLLRRPGMIDRFDRHFDPAEQDPCTLPLLSSPDISLQQFIRYIKGLQVWYRPHMEAQVLTVEVDLSSGQGKILALNAMASKLNTTSGWNRIHITPEPSAGICGFICEAEQTTLLRILLDGQPVPPSQIQVGYGRKILSGYPMVLPISDPGLELEGAISIPEPGNIWLIHSRTESRLESAKDDQGPFPIPQIDHETLRSIGYL